MASFTLQQVTIISYTSSNMDSSSLKAWVYESTQASGSAHLKHWDESAVDWSIILRWQARQLGWQSLFHGWKLPPLGTITNIIIYKKYYLRGVQVIVRVCVFIFSQNFLFVLHLNFLGFYITLKVEKDLMWISLVLLFFSLTKTCNFNTGG